MLRTLRVTFGLPASDFSFLGLTPELLAACPLGTSLCAQLRLVLAGHHLPRRAVHGLITAIVKPVP